MNNVYKTVIIGGGFSGLVAACTLGEAFGEKIAIAEGNDRVAKKILATGNGRCNLTNSAIAAKAYRAEPPEFIGYALEKFDSEKLCEKFYSYGVPVTFEGDKGYPLSKQASCVADALRFKCEDCGVKVFTDFKCDKIAKNADGTFSVYSRGRELRGEKVLLACGGAAGKAYGTDGSGYALAKSLGHTVTEIYPSLVQLKTQTDKIRGLKGIKCVAEVCALSDGKVASTSTGDVLFTDYGVSGNAIFSVSSAISGAKNAELVLSFVPEKTQAELTEIIKNAIFALPDKSGEEVLGGIVNKRVARAVLKAADCGAEIRYAAKIARTLKNFTLKVEGTLGFDCAQVTHGGVRLTEVNPRTMESKIVKGLYFSGEILDVDGDCGGFNLQWAFSSGSAAAVAIINE